MLRVLRDVDQELAHCPEEDRAFDPPERLGLAVVGNLDREAMQAPHLPAEPMQCGNKAELVEDGRAQLEGERSGDAAGLLDELSHLLQVPP